MTSCMNGTNTKEETEEGTEAIPIRNDHGELIGYAQICDNEPNNVLVEVTNK